jgi:hypothetical protein
MGRLTPDPMPHEHSQAQQTGNQDRTWLEVTVSLVTVTPTPNESLTVCPSAFVTAARRSVGPNAAPCNRVTYWLVFTQLCGGAWLD